MRREYSHANLNIFLDTNDECFSQSQRNFYPKKNKIVNTESNQSSAPNIMSKIPYQVNENYEDWIYVEDTKESLNYIGKPILNTNLYEFICEENKKKYLAKIGDLSDISREVNILRNLSHNNILKWRRYFTEDDKTYMLYDYCGNIITLDQYLIQRKTLSENEVKNIIIQLINLLKYLKSQNIIHNCLSLNNIIMTKGGEIKVMEFDKAIKLTSGQNYYERKYGNSFDAFLNDKNYSSYILSPDSQIFDSKENWSGSSTIKLSYENDLWAVGRIMYYLLIGGEPYIYLDTTDMNEFLKNLKNNYNISYQARDCLKRILEPNQKQRHKLNQIFMLPFFKDVYY